ncbi:unnamed protein product [Closterium sp. NIES-65]|nr:unnamed protein product [Closterium sp. NIES-65]
MRGSNDRLEVFKLSENLWFAGTAQLPPFEDAGNGGKSEGDNSGGDKSGGDNSGGDNSGNNGNSTGNDNSGSDSSAGFADDPRDSMESRKEELLARLRGGGMEAANADSRSSASASAAPASAPAPAVDPLEQQTEQRVAEVGEFSARTTELKPVVKRKPAVGFPGINEYSGVMSAMVVYDKQGKQLTRIIPHNEARA